MLSLIGELPLTDGVVHQITYNFGYFLFYLLIYILIYT